MSTQTMAVGRIAAASSERPGGLRGLLERLAAAWNERRRIARTIAELEALSDHELADIGLARADIERVARGLVRIDR